MVAAGAGFLWTAGNGVANTGGFSPIRSFSIIAAAVIGGLGTLSGALIGATYMYAVPEYLREVSPVAGLLATGVGLLVLIMFLPGGLSRLAFRGRERLAQVVTGVDPRPKVQDESREGAPVGSMEPVFAEVSA
jgi:branched-chain amino acid transport system permease protein